MTEFIERMRRVYIEPSAEEIVSLRRMVTDFAARATEAVNSGAGIEELQALLTEGLNAIEVVNAAFLPSEGVH